MTSKILKRLLLFFFAIAVGILSSFAQDVITLKDGKEIIALVYEIGDIDVEYKKIDNPGGPNYTLKKAEISMIKYANGSKDVFSEIKQGIDNVGVVINGVRWATCNVDKPGTFAAKPEDFGMFYQWNRKKACPTTGSISGWNNSDASGTIWEKANDPSPPGWRVPTSFEIKSLLDTNKVSCVWITVNGVTGGKFTDKTSGNSIFLPATGRRDYSWDQPYLVGTESSYWSSTQTYDRWNGLCANGLWINDYNTFVQLETVLDLLDSGYPVRSVAENLLNDLYNVNIAVDIIILKNQEGIQAIVSKIGTNEVEYKKFDNQSGPVYTLKKSEIFMIKYANGSKEVFIVSNNNVISNNEGVVINGVRWATRNVDKPGTFVARPEDVGMFYQWNRKIAWPATGNVSGWNNSDASGTTWEKANDPSPAGWRVPTSDEIKSLLNTDKVDKEWTELNGVIGIKFIDRFSGNSLFLPAAGARRSYDGMSMLNSMGLSGNYWSSTSCNNLNALYMSLVGSSDPGCGGRSFGFSVRSVSN